MRYSPQENHSTYTINNTGFSIQPVVYDPCNSDDWHALCELKNNTPHITINDALLGQVKELIKAKHPKKKLKGNTLLSMAKEWLGDTPERKGLWAYYPWKHTLVHILNKKDFIFLRTNRNHYKITPEEQDFLSTKTIGVIGLSVGHAIAVTLASERICSEIRLADFDIIELSNLNRIKTSLTNLDIPKVVVTAREIAEIDPFITIRIEPKGITEDTLSNFLSMPHPIDVLIEECDSIDVKFMARYKARELKIPVVMDTSDRGLMDIERFDLEPNRPIFHGLIEELEPDYLNELSTEEKVPYVLKIIGKDTMSKRMKASLVEVEDTTTTWPQLSSGVTIGGGITTDITRRLLLNEFTDSGRYFVDVADIVKNQAPKPTLHSDSIAFQISKNSAFTVDAAVNIVQSYNENTHANPAPLSEPTAHAIIEHAIQAPSGGNCQPWQWAIKDNIIYLFHDNTRSASLLDYNHYASYVALGAAIENASLYCKNNGLAPHILMETQYPLVATLSVTPTSTVPSNTDNTLFKALKTRQTNRLLNHNSPLEKETLSKIEDWTDVADGELNIIAQNNEVSELADIIAEGERLRLLDPTSHKDLMNELRWTDKESNETRTGIDIETFNLTSSDYAGFQVVSDPSVTKLLQQWNRGNALKKHTLKGIKAAAAIACFSVKGRPNPSTYFNGGRALQRLWIKLNAEGIAIQPVSPLLYLFQRLNNDSDTELSPFLKQELIKLYTRYQRIIEDNPDTTPILLFRLFKTDQQAKPSVRLKSEDVIIKVNEYATIKANSL